MPYSAFECKTWIADQVLAVNPRRILDVGAGAGTYSDLLRPALPYASFTAIEIWPPYVADYSLNDKYDTVLMGDFLTVGETLRMAPRFDVVILGDVIEHFAPDDAYRVYELARELGKYVVVSTPVEPWPQGEEHGNPYEAHLYEFSLEELSSLPGVFDSTQEGKIGAVVADGI